MVPCRESKARSRVGLTKRTLLLLVLPFCRSLQGQATGGTTPFQEGVEALKRGDFPAAEMRLKAELQSHPNEVEALSFLGAALDSQSKFTEADAVHRRALALAPRSNSVLDKYGSHQAASGDEAGARKTFLKALAIYPADGYANLQLAQLALKSKNGPEALSYLDRLSAEQRNTPDVAVRRLVALELSGRYTEARSLSEAFRNDAGWSASAGRALADAGEYDHAEALLEDALAASPANFAVLYALGGVTLRAGHFARSREALEAALRLQPRNVDVLISLAFVLDALKESDDAELRLLMQAAQLAPQRASVQKSLAIAAGNLGDYKDAAAAWNRYVALDPEDDTGRRERGFADAHIGQLDTGIADLRWYIARHSDDAEAYFDLGIAESAKDPTKGLPSFDKAVALRPDFAAARSARGALYYRDGRPEAALPDLEFAAAAEPGDAMIQDRLGQVYQALDRLRDAIRCYRRATDLAPDDYPAQFHLANALAEDGQTAESDKIFERIRTWPVREHTTDLLPDAGISGATPADRKN
jgi:tetratricopeptide (TPR) repeat protein